MKKIIIIFSSLIILVISFALFYVLMPKFKDVTVSIGATDIDKYDFLTFNIFRSNLMYDVDLSNVDTNVAGTYNLILNFKGKEETVKLTVVDDVAPVVEFQDVTTRVGNKPEASEFIVSSYDQDNCYITMDDSEVDYNNLGSYNVKVRVTDDYGNYTEKTCKLNIQLFYDNVIHELGTKLSVEEFLVDKSIKNDIKSSNINSIDVKKLGTYTFTCTYDGKNYSTSFEIRDTVAPVIKTKNITHMTYSSKKVTTNDLLVSVTDADTYTLETTGTIDLNKLGEQVITFKATDASGNVSTANATLTVKNDNTGPVFSGLKDISVNKGEKPDYLTNVKAKDKKDGAVTFTYDDSQVDLDSFGDYTVTYTAKDKSGNVTTKTRTVHVLHSQEDTDALFLEYYNKYLKGKSVLDMTLTIRSTIGYAKIRGTDAVWTGLTTMTGSCYVHAAMLDKALEVAGIEHMMIQNNSGTHYWVLVKEDGKWRHYDPTPGQHKPGPLTDKQKSSYEPGIGRLNWDRSKYPAAE